MRHEAHGDTGREGLCSRQKTISDNASRERGNLESCFVKRVDALEQELMATKRVTATSKWHIQGKTSECFLLRLFLFFAGSEDALVREKELEAYVDKKKKKKNKLKKLLLTAKDPKYHNTIVAETVPLVTAPLIVLVNNKTASSSEIVRERRDCASAPEPGVITIANNIFGSNPPISDDVLAKAFQLDKNVAVLVGEKTFSKGLIQSVFELNDGSGVVVTVGKYVTPNHMDINGNGIEPDYRIPGGTEVAKHLLRLPYRRNGSSQVSTASFQIEIMV
ncbi:hypothetical protein IFM89_015971 [Coptis chinensis]|uniref:Tail specific protease domain-containing protein n=1 Tax=Coptis chinensis TaxID=261450 RepID=A0A835HV35_9MAGN|nr:hypothetical protein IFM89_015971 [Coptis chinensis]